MHPYITVPTHRPNLRKDKPHAMFRTATARWNAVADLVVSCHWEGRPVLVARPSIIHARTHARARAHVFALNSRLSRLREGKYVLFIFLLVSNGGFKTDESCKAARMKIVKIVVVV